MKYSISEIKEILSAEGQIVSGENKVKYLLTDSRNISFAEQSLFIAIKGRHFNGHQFIENAYISGVRNFLLEQDSHALIHADANYLFVKNSINALQKLAAFHRKKFSLDVIGITGSNGKTIVKEWVNYLLRSHRNICRNPKSYNSQIGVPLSIWQLNSHHNLGIFEAGISQPDEMEKLEKIIQPTIGVFTNIGTAHDEGFINREEKIQEKLKLFAGDQLDVLFYCIDYPLLSKNIQAQIKSGIGISWSRHANNHADIQIKNISVKNSYTVFDIFLIGRQIKNLEIPFTDDISLENAISALLVADNAGLDVEELRSLLKTLPPVSMRLELKKGINNCQIINDVYNSDISSLEIALHFLQRQKQNYHTHLILSDIDESGISADALYLTVANLVKENHLNQFTGIGKEISSHKKLFEGITNLKLSFYDDTLSFIKNFNADLFHNQFILIKGARRFELEKISNLLSKQTHGTFLQINLNNLVHNLNVYRRMLLPHVKTMAMVKAFSYGSGTAEIANVLAANHADYLAVAYTDEGVELRKNGIHLPVMVMNAEPETFEHLIEFQLEPEIYNLRILNLLIDFLNSNRRFTEEKKEIKIHLKIDTGMHRLGFSESETDAAISLIKKHSFIKLASIFSHLAAADDEQETVFTNQQIHSFERISKRIMYQFQYPILRHILNSSGISRFPEAQFDMVRLGIGMYGDDPSNKVLQKLLPVSFLFTTVSQIKEISEGDSIGYGRSFITKKQMRIATLNIGYADGFSRRLGNGIGQVFLKGKFAAVCGSVCMDMLMVDISDIPEVKEGDKAEIFGEHITLQKFASNIGTIPYEVLTGISQRVKRIYIQE